MKCIVCLLVISFLVEIVGLCLSADISYSPGYKCSRVVHSFTAGVWSYLLHGSKYISNYCFCHLYLYSQLLCGVISCQVGARKRWGPPWNGSGKSVFLYELVYSFTAIFWKVFCPGPLKSKHSRSHPPWHVTSSHFLKSYNFSNLVLVNEKYYEEIYMEGVMNNDMSNYISLWVKVYLSSRNDKNLT